MEKPDQGVLNIISKLVENTDQVWTHLVKPFKHRYSPESLGTPVQVWSNAVYEKLDGSFVNDRGMNIVYSYFKNTSAADPDASFTVLYLHSHGGCKVEGYHLMKHLGPIGANLCLFDFAGCGLSGGDYISMGIFEKVDALQMIKVLREDFGVQNLVVWGRSMGAATALQAFPKMAGVYCLVLDSPFEKVSNVYSNAVKQRMSVPGFVVNMVYSYATGQILEKLGFDVESIRPYEFASRIKIPTVLIGSKEDKITDYEDLCALHRLLPLPENEKVIMDCDGQHNDDRNPIVIQRAVEFAANILKAKRKRTNQPKALPASFQFRSPPVDPHSQTETRHLRRGRHEVAAFSSDIANQRQNHHLFEEYKKHYFPEHAKQSAIHNQSFVLDQHPAQEPAQFVQFSDLLEDHSDMPRREIIKRRTGNDMVNLHRSVNPTFRNERPAETAALSKPEPRDAQTGLQGSRKNSPHAAGGQKRLGSFGAANFSVGNLHSYQHERPNSPKPSFFQAFPKVGSPGNDYDYQQPVVVQPITEESKPEGNQLFTQYYQMVQGRYAKPPEEQGLPQHQVPESHPQQLMHHSDSRKRVHHAAPIHHHQHHQHQHHQHQHHQPHHNTSFDTALLDQTHRNQQTTALHTPHQPATHLGVHQPYRPLLGTGSRRASDLQSQAAGLHRQARSYRTYPEELVHAGAPQLASQSETQGQPEVSTEQPAPAFANSPSFPPKYLPVPSLLSKQRVSEVAQASYKPVYPSQPHQQYY